jgi:hypothetical protein
MTKKSPGLNWGLIVGILFSLTVWGALFGGLLHAQGALPASTGCIGDSVVTLFRPEIEADSMAKGELDAHEAVHRFQIDSIMRTAHVSCFVAMASLTLNYETNLRFEAPAYKAQGNWNQKHRPGFDRREFDMAVAKALLFYYESHIPIGTIFSQVSGHLSDPWVAQGVDITPGTTVTGVWPSPYRTTDPLTNTVQ